MLQHLFIENVAIIEKLDIEFSNGFNVITGETGAGKSIVIDALNLILGERASRELIRSGADSAKVEAIFNFDDAANDGIMRKLESLDITCEDGQLFISRTLSASGKNICRINGELVPLTALKEVGDSLADVHGQHAHQSLLSPALHIHYIDAYKKSETTPLLAAIADVYEQRRLTESRLHSGFSSAAERERKIDILSYQIDEITKAELHDGEDKSLLEESNLLANAEKIQYVLNSSTQILSGAENNALDNIMSVSRMMGDISDFSNEYREIHTKLEELYYALEDTAYALRDMKNGFEYDPQRLDEIGKRLDLIASLKLKYGSTIADILQFQTEAETELNEILSMDTVRQKLEEELKKLTEQYYTLAEQLSCVRKEAAAEVEDHIVRELKMLGMEKAQFKVNFEDGTAKPIRKNGFDQVEFLFSANVGEPLKPLAKVISGGEMSRVMLALKSTLSSKDDIPTLVFDEIDAGISGRVASAVGEKIARLAKTHQVFCITHLPQIAAMGDQNYLIQKEQSENTTTTHIKRLSEKEREQEVARIMGDAYASDLAVQYARELIQNGKNIKNS